jgi:aminotransferase
MKDRLTKLSISPRMRELPPVGSREVAEQIETARKKGVRVLNLAPYPVRTLPPHVVEAAVQAIAKNEEAPSRGLPRLRQAIAVEVSRAVGREVCPDTEIQITNGAMQALNIVFRTLLAPGDEVLIPSPCFFFHGCVELAGGRTVYVPMAEENGFAWDFEAIARAITGRTRIIVVNTPVNPTGRVLTRAELATLAELALAHDLLLISDESYDRLVYDGLRHESVAALPQVASQTILIKSCTKSYAMPGWRVGYIVAPPEMVSLFNRALEWEQLHVCHVAQATAAAAIEGPQYWLTNAAAEFQAARDFLLAGFNRLAGLSCVRPKGGPFIFLNTSRLFSSSREASDALLAVGVPTTPGFYCQSDAHVRLAFGADPAVLGEVVARLAKVAGQRTSW